MTHEEKFWTEFKVEDTVDLIRHKSRQDVLTLDLYKELLDIIEENIQKLKAAGIEVRPLEQYCGYVQIEVMEDHNM